MESTGILLPADSIVPCFLFTQNWEILKNCDYPQNQRRDVVRHVLPAINIPSQEFLSNGAYLRFL